MLRPDYFRRLGVYGVIFALAVYSIWSVLRVPKLLNCDSISHSRKGLKSHRSIVMLCRGGDLGLRGGQKGEHKRVTNFGMELTSIGRNSSEILVSGVIYAIFVTFFR
ncbi:hypothetical protein B0H13DRAFT_2064682 [Mycena leptocephala]|nr:hypothetical protein B0H13DRAFT_2064682 [Mycena leptocephala]